MNTCKYCNRKFNSSITKHFNKHPECRKAHGELLSKCLSDSLKKIMENRKRMFS